MASLLSAPIAVRPRRGLLRMMVPALVVLAAVGCGHKRQSMRPVLITPRANCPSSVTIPAESGIIPAQPSAPPVLEPIVPMNDGSVTGASTGSGSRSGSIPSYTPSTTSPPRPGLPDEPAYDPGPSNSSKVPSLNGPALRAPNSSSLNNDRRSPSGRLRQSALRTKLGPFVANPDDLFEPPKADRPWQYVVLHHSAHASGGYDQIDRDHRKVLGWEGCGYHFIIGNGTGSPDGRIEVAQRWTNQKNGVHCRNGKTPEVNEYGIGICLVGDLDAAGPTPRQIEAARALVAYLGDRYAIPTDHIGTHARLANAPTDCPGKHFPAQAILGTRNLAQR